jgi:dipeptidase
VRQYSVQSRVAPSLDLKPKQMPYEYAFSVAVDEKLDRAAVMNLFRNFYEGTEFDLTGVSTLSHTKPTVTHVTLSTLSTEHTKRTKHAVTQ